jgi:hypothetical protein
MDGSKNYTLPTRDTEKTVWPQMLIDLLKGIGKIHTNPEGRMFLITEYTVGEEMGIDFVEVLVKEEVATANGGGI